MKKNIRIKKLSNKLDNKKLDLYKIKIIKKPFNYKLELLINIRIHFIFHVLLLKLIPLDILRILYIEINPINLNAEY